MKLFKIDIILEVLGWFLLILLWIGFIYTFNQLPNIIPGHFDASGNIDGYTAKNSIIGLPIVATILFSILTIINYYPHLCNYPVKITIENAKFQYTLATRLLRILKSFILILFGTIIYIIQLNVNGSKSTFEFILIYIEIILLFIFIFYFYKKSKKAGNA